MARLRSGRAAEARSARFGAPEVSVDASMVAGAVVMTQVSQNAAPRGQGTIPQNPLGDRWGVPVYGARVPALPSDADDHQVASVTAEEAGDLLAELQQNGKSGWGWLEDEGDAQAHRFLMNRLQDLRGDDAVLSEEGRDTRERLDSERVWIVDPLDGSNDFGLGQAEWAVHVALAVDGELTAAAVAVPGMGRVFCTDDDDERDEPDRDQPIVIVGRSRVWADGHRVADALGAKLASCGSAGVKAMLVVSGEVDVYVHASPLYEWDVAAPAAVAAAAGLHVSAPDGGPLRFNNQRPVVPGLVVARPHLADEVLAALA